MGWSLRRTLFDYSRPKRSENRVGGGKEEGWGVKGATVCACRSGLWQLRKVSAYIGSESKRRTSDLGRSSVLRDWYLLLAFCRDKKKKDDNRSGGEGKDKKKKKKFQSFSLFFLFSTTRRRITDESWLSIPYEMKFFNHFPA